MKNCPNHPANPLVTKSCCQRCIDQRDRRNDARRAAGKCPNHPVESLPCSRCREQGKDHYDALRLEVLGHYCGGKPACQCPGCNISFIGFLCMDHMTKKGRHRRGPSLLNWLRRNRYPKGFQVLCANCNQSKKNQSACALSGHKH